MEDSSFIYRSMYAAHIRIWLRLFPPSQLLVMAPDSLLQPGSAAEGMRTLARFAGLPESSGQHGAVAIIDGLSARQVDAFDKHFHESAFPVAVLEKGVVFECLNGQASV